MASSAPGRTAVLLLLIVLFFNLAASANVAPRTPSGPITAKTCKDNMKFGMCVNLLKDLLHLATGTPADKHCCTLLGGLADLEAAVCLCTVFKAQVMGMDINIPISMSMVMNHCGKNVPSEYQCHT